MPKDSDVKITQLVHPQIASAKLRALCDGATIASKKLWSRIEKCLCGMYETRSRDFRSNSPTLDFVPCMSARASRSCSPTKKKVNERLIKTA